MAFKDIMTGLTPQRVAAIKALMDQLETELRFTIKLSLWEKQTLSPIGDRRYPFVEKANQYAQDYPNLMPPIRSAVNFNRVKFDYDAITYIGNRLASLAEKVHDTDLQISNNCYDFSLVFYNMVDYAAKSDQPGTQAVKNDLSTLFDRQGPSGTDEETESLPVDGGSNGGGGNNGGNLKLIPTPEPGDENNGGTGI